MERVLSWIPNFWRSKSTLNKVFHESYKTTETNLILEEKNEIVIETIEDTLSFSINEFLECLEQESDESDDEQLIDAVFKDFPKNQVFKNIEKIMVLSRNHGEFNNYSIEVVIGSDGTETTTGENIRKMVYKKGIRGCRSLLPVLKKLNEHMEKASLIKKSISMKAIDKQIQQIDAIYELQHQNENSSVFGRCGF